MVGPETEGPALGCSLSPYYFALINLAMLLIIHRNVLSTSQTQQNHCYYLGMGPSEPETQILMAAEKMQFEAHHDHILSV